MIRGIKSKKWSSAGFTLAELLITIAIIAILGAVVTVAAFSMLRNARQAASDKVAEGLYSAVTTHLQEIWAFDYGDVATLQKGEKAIGVSDEYATSILYVKKDRGAMSPGTSADIMNVVLGEEGSAVSREYYQDSIIVEYNPSSLQVHSVFYSSEVLPDDYYKEEGSAQNTLRDLRYDVTKRKTEFNGYLGYYQAATQDLPELVENEYGVTVGLTSPYADNLRHLRNLDELTAPISIHIPSEEEENIDTLKLEITLVGKSSGASAKLTYDEQDTLNGGILKNYGMDLLKESNEFEDAKMVSFELVLDNLKEGNFNELFCLDAPGDKTTTIRFYGKPKNAETEPNVYVRKVPLGLTANAEGGLFIPGEDIEVKVSAIYADGVEKDISDESKNLAVDNSIFAYGSREEEGTPKEYHAYLAYGRHLQNLSQDVSKFNTGVFVNRPVKAYQVDHIDFTKEDKNYESEHRWLWVDLYSDKSKTIPYEAARPFLPIVNPDIVGFYGDYKLEYSDSAASLNAISLRSGEYMGPTEYTINGMVVRSTSEKTITNAGVFESFSGGEIKNISITNPRISGEGVTGGLVANAALKYGETLKIENCALYMTEEYCGTYEESSAPYGITEDKSESEDPYIQDDSDVKGLWMSGKENAGGLVGIVSHDENDTASSGEAPSLLIKNSHASTVINTTGNGASGGLIGYVGQEGHTEKVSVTLERCYADSYIYGADTGGLIGRIAPESSVGMSFVYTAGFQIGSIQSGLANGTLDSVEKSYVFGQMRVDKDATAFTTAARILSASDVYYFPLKNANSGNAGKITDEEQTVSVEELVKDYPTKTVTEILLMKLGSAFEEDPGDTGPYNLREGMALSTYTKPRLKNLIHYGDWEEDFMPGALCYFEKYVKEGSKVRFYGGNYNSLYDSLEDGVAVRADGYGLVYRKNDVRPDMAEVTYFFQGAGEEGVRETIDLNTAPYIEAEYEDQTYIIYPFDKKNVNYVLTEASPFYTKVEVTYQNKGEGDTVVSSDTEVFYFNPHFARAVGYLGRKDSGTSGGEGVDESSSAEEVPLLKQNGVIYVRSPRHLYDLSLYYKFYREDTKGGRTYRQTYDLSYKDYDWHGYFSDLVPEDSVIYRQNPIALSKGESFIAKYNGGCYKIRDISFVLEEDRGEKATSFTGLFGYNEGELRNIVLFADYTEDDASAALTGSFTDTEHSRNHYYALKTSPMHYYAGTDKDISKNNELYLGVLAGRNAGTVVNCATAGYFLADAKGTIVGNSNGYIYAGGLLGHNTGTVNGSASDTPFIRLTTNYATAFIGGFTGNNAGRIGNSYALGHIDVVNPRGGAITLAGFAAKNSGEIASCYAAENIQSSGNTTVYAFSPKGGNVSKSEYLYKGTFTYVGHLYPYNYPNDKGTGVKKTWDELIAEGKTTTPVKAGNTEDYPKYEDGQDYPYRAVVTDRNGEYIHYGDWQRKPDLGEFGVFYWEKEEGSGNAGYHFSYVGIGGDKDTAGTSLCNAHDDNGIIVDYGYGYYEKKEKAGQIVISRDQRGEETFQDRGLFIPEASLSDVAAKLEEQAPEFVFYPYRTLKCNGGDKASSIYLNYDAAKVMGDETGEETRNGKLVLKKKDALSGDQDWSFYVAPFFANALSMAPESAREESLSVTALDWINKTDYMKTPGTEENPYEIRTVEQLQYINWNAATQNVSTMVTGEETVYKAFPYLAYAKVTGRGTQKKAAAGHNNTLKFLQTHDASGVYANGSPVIDNYTPIAPSYTASTLEGYDAVLYAWFGSDYDGQSYKITNINISSPAYSVGVFGVTVSAGLNNMILYSDRSSVIERSTAADSPLGGYSIGGLVGIAYKYDEDKTTTINNCAVAGYRIVDNSKNQQTQGESNVGGLIGATRVDVKNCSAVTDMEINCTHPHDDARKYKGHAKYGDYVRAGGLIGALPGKAINCYSGGSIKVGEATLAESRDGDGALISESEEDGAVCWREYSMNMYIGGIAGSAFSMNYQNFTNKTGADDASPTMKNCYTYVELPELRGSIRSIAMIASLADRYSNDSSINGYYVNIINCHYLKEFDQSKVENAARYRIRSDGNHIGPISPYTALNDANHFSYINDGDAGETYFENMVRGGGTYITYVTGYKNQRLNKKTYDEDDHPTALTYAQLSGDEGNIKVWDRASNAWETYGDGYIKAALNQAGDQDGTYGWVTVEQQGAKIPGKYSFPGNNKVLDGLDYPFPTIVTQRDLVYNRVVNVHYGEWPLEGMYWSEARSEMDLFGDQEADGWAYKKLQVLEVPEEVSLTKDAFTMETGGIVEVAELTGPVGGTYTVKFKALKTGTETVTVGGATLVLEVKANVSISTNPTEMTLKSVSAVEEGDATRELTLSANALSTPDPETGVVTTKDYSDKTRWTLQIMESDTGYVGYIDKTPGVYEKTLDAGKKSCYITGAEPGKTQIVVTGVLSYNGADYSSSLYLPLQTYGVIGLSNYKLSSATDGEGFWNETSRAPEGTYGGTDRKDVYSAAEKKPVLQEDGWTDLYLYETYTDETLGSAKITGISIEGSPVAVTDDGSHTTYTAAGYAIDIGSASEKLSTDGNYRYRSLKLRPESGSGGEVTVQITLKDGETDASYTVSGRLKATHVVTANSNEPEGTGEKAELLWTSLHAETDGTLNLKNAGIPTLKGYTFLGWSETEDGDAAYCTGDGNITNPTITITEDKELFAKWTPISYTIDFGSNGLIDPLNPLPSMTVSYDEEATLPATIDAYYSKPSPEYHFVGWNTAEDGSGIAYKPGAVVRNLMAEPGTVTLYAQWRDRYNLIFMDYKDGTIDPQKTKVELAANEYAYATSEAVLPTGATKTEKNGQWGYYWTSGSGSTYRLIGWDTVRRRAPADVAYQIAFDGEGNPTFPGITGIDGDTTYYAIWAEVTYSVTLMDTLSGTPVSTVFSDLGGGLKKLSDISGYVLPAKAGYTFAGWYNKTIEEGGKEKIAGSDSLLADGKTLSELADTTGNLTLYARYSEDVYVRLTNTNLTNGKDYLIAITELGDKSLGTNAGRFAYLLTNSTESSMFCNKAPSGTNDLAGIDHAFKDADGKFYLEESGTTSLGSVVYMDTASMPTDVTNLYRNTTPISMEIPGSAIWTFEGSGNVGTFKLSGSTDGYLYLGSGGSRPILRQGSVTAGETWTYEKSGDYFRLRSTTNTNYGLYCNYWNYNMSTKNVNDKNARVNLYEKTTVYLDEAP